MVEELGVTDNPDRVGFYSGLVVSGYHVAGHCAHPTHSIPGSCL